MRFKKVVEFIVVTCVAIALATFCFTLISSPNTFLCILGFALFLAIAWLYSEYAYSVIKISSIYRKLKNKKFENK